MPSDAKHSTERSGVVFRITAILESFTRESPRLPLRDIAAAAGLPASTARRLLVQLEDSGLVSQDPDSQLYTPTAKLAHIGSLALNNASLEEVARPGLKRLASLSGEAAFLGRVEQRDVKYLVHETIAREVTISIQTGDSRPALTTAIGSVIIAHSPSLYAEEYEGRAFQRDEVVQTLQDRFENTIESMREHGYALGLGGITRESTSIAVPVMLAGERVPAAIAVSGPSYRFSHEDALALVPELVKEAENISRTFATH